MVLLEGHLYPISLELHDVVRRVLNAHDRVTIIDLNSFSAEELPYGLLRHPDAQRPEPCLGTDLFNTPNWLVEAVWAALVLSQTKMSTRFSPGEAPQVLATLIQVAVLC